MTNNNQNTGSTLGQALGTGIIGAGLVTLLTSAVCCFPGPVGLAYNYLNPGAKVEQLLDGRGCSCYLENAPLTAKRVKDNERMRLNDALYAVQTCTGCTTLPPALLSIPLGVGLFYIARRRRNTNIPEE